MSKTNLFLTSLVAAIPGALLAYFMVMAFLDYAGGSSGMLKGLAGMALVLGGLLAVMPFGILIANRAPSAKKETAKAKEGDEESEEGSVDADAESAEMVEDMEGADDLEVAGEAEEVVESADEVEEVEAVAADDGDATLDFQEAETEEMAFDEAPADTVELTDSDEDIDFAEDDGGKKGKK